MAEFFVDRNSACAAWNTAVLQGHCFVSRLDCLHLKSNHTKQLNSKWVSYGSIRDSAALHGKLQCCRVYVLSADFILST